MVIASLMILKLFIPLIFATKPTPQESNSNSGQYNPRFCCVEEGIFS